jgi:hypothetical protein
MAKYCKCGSLMVFTVCSNRKCPELKDAKSTEWIINERLYTFKKSLTKAEAQEAYLNKKNLADEDKISNNRRYVKK